MRVALCYSGQPRDIESTYENHRKTIFDANQDCQIDTFIHFWSSDVDNFWFNPLTDNSVQHIANLYKPTKMVYEPGKVFNYPGIEPDPRFPHPIYKMLSMFYSIEQANNLKSEHEKENGFTYDCVIRLRTDEVFIDNPSLHQNPIPVGSLSSYDMDFLNVMEWYIHQDYGIHDHFAFGSSEIMDKYSNVFSNFSENVNMGAAINPECILGFNIQIRQGVPLKKHQWNHYMYRDVKDWM